MTPGDDLFPTEDGDTPLTPEEQLGLIPSLSTRAQLNELERHTINAARIWAMRPKTLARPDLVTDTSGPPRRPHGDPLQPQRPA